MHDGSSSLVELYPLDGLKSGHSHGIRESICFMLVTLNDIKRNKNGALALHRRCPCTTAASLAMMPWCFVWITAQV